MFLRSTAHRTFAALALLLAVLLAGCGVSQRASNGKDDLPPDGGSPQDPAPEEPVPDPTDPARPDPTDPEAPEDPGSEEPSPEGPSPEEPEEPEEPGTEEPEEPGSEDPTPDPEPTGTVPGDLLDLRRWKLTLPIETEHEGNPDEIVQPELSTFAIAPYFTLTETKDGVVFRAPVEGATTGGSDYPRTELREMTADGSDEASWSTTSGTHTLEIRQAITHLPEVKRHVVAGQIHDADDDVIMIRLEGKHLFVEGDGEELATLDADYELGTVFTVKMVAAEGRIRVYYDGALALDLAHEASGCYFKAGAYTQSNLEKGDAEGAYGEVVIYDLRLSHE